jgi:hypothetical protein
MEEDMTDHATTLEATLAKPADTFRRSEPAKFAPLTPSMTRTQDPAMLKSIAELLLALPHEQIKHMSREVLSDLVTVSDKTVADLIEATLSWAHRELKNSA